MTVRYHTRHSQCQNQHQKWPASELVQNFIITFHMVITLTAGTYSTYGISSPYSSDMYRRALRKSQVLHYGIYRFTQPRSLGPTWSRSRGPPSWIHVQPPPPICTRLQQANVFESCCSSSSSKRHVPYFCKSQTSPCGHTCPADII